MTHYKSRRIKLILLVFLSIYIVYGTCVAFGAELSQENSDGATRVTAKIEEQPSQPTTEEIPDDTDKPEDNPPIPTGEKLTLGFLFLIIAAGTAVIAVTYSGAKREKLNDNYLFTEDKINKNKK